MSSSELFAAERSLKDGLQDVGALGKRLLPGHVGHDEEAGDSNNERREVPERPCRSQHALEAKCTAGQQHSMGRKDLRVANSRKITMANAIAVN